MVKMRIAVPAYAIAVVLKQVRYNTVVRPVGAKVQNCPWGQQNFYGGLYETHSLFWRL
jgi:hypothetical protein